MIKIIITPILLILLVYVLFGVLLFLGQKRFIYYPTNRDFDNCPGFADAEKINQNGTRAYFQKNSDTLVVFYHGNAGSACGRTYMKRMIENAGHSYLIVEYAGYSGDQRSPSRELLFRDAENMAEFIEEKNFQKVLLVGESIGGSVAAHHAEMGRYDAMLLIAPFDSMRAVAQNAFPLYPAKWLLMEDYDNVEMLRDKDNIWIMHGTNDNVIPMKHSEKLFESIESKDKKYFEISGAGHNDILDFEKTVKVIKDFLIYRVLGAQLQARIFFACLRHQRYFKILLP